MSSQTADLNAPESPDTAKRAKAKNKMSWSIRYDEKWKRDIGYGVPAYCDHPDCSEAIDRGLAHVCGGEPYGGERGCGLYFCGKHHGHGYPPSLCIRCARRNEPFPAKPEHPDWIKHKLTLKTGCASADCGPAHGSATCQIRGCRRPAVVEISGYALTKPGWWRVCQTHRYVFAAQRPLSPNGPDQRPGR